MDNFRCNSTAFKSNAWRTDIVCVSNGLAELDGFPELDVSALISF